MWTYKISTGQLFDSNKVQVCRGYSGYGVNRNDPTKISIPHEGPLPFGDYDIGSVYTHEHLGPYVMNLEPHPTNTMFGRSLFQIHGVSKDNPATPEDESLLSSHGCICISRDYRILISKSADRVLRVIA